MCLFFWLVALFYFCFQIYILGPLTELESSDNMSAGTRIPAKDLKEKRVNSSLTKLTHVQACREQVRWSDVVGTELSSVIDSLAKSLNTKRSQVGAFLLAAVNATMNENTTIEVSSTHIMKPNLYIVVVSEKGCGKTQVYQELLEKPFISIQGSKNIEIFVQDLSKSGILKHIQEHKQALVSAEELGLVLNKMVSSSSTDDFAGFRDNLKTFYGTGRVSKLYLSKTVLLEKHYLTIAGATQPEPFCRFLESLLADDDGAGDRFLFFFSPKATEIFEVFGPFLPDEFSFFDIQEMVMDLYDHHRSGKITYTLSEAAKGFLQMIENDEKEEDDVNWNLYEECLDTGNTAAVLDIENRHSKCSDATVKVASSLNLLKYGYQKQKSKRPKSPIQVPQMSSFSISTLLASGNSHGEGIPATSENTQSTSAQTNNTTGSAATTPQIDTGALPEGPPTVIEEAELKAAYTLVCSARKQQRIYTDFVLSGKCERASMISKESASTSKKRIADKTETIILSTPGPAVTTLMLGRASKRPRVAKHEAMKAFESMAENKLGKIVPFGYRAKNTGFFKVPPKKIDEDQLKVYGISKEEYARLYQLPQEKVSGKLNWDEYIQELMENQPYRDAQDE